MSRTFHDDDEQGHEQQQQLEGDKTSGLFLDDEQEQEQKPTSHPIDTIYEGRPDVSEMSYEELEREIKYERAMVEAESTRTSTGPDWREASEIAIGQNGQIHEYNKVVERAEELGKEDGRQVQDEISIRRQATEQELEPSYARQNEIYIELERRDNLEKSYEGKPDVSKMTYEGLEREIRYERAMVEGRTGGSNRRTEQELESSYARQNEIYIELERRDNLKTPSNELTKEAHQAIGELDERGKDAKTSTQELSKEAREATREIREKDRDRHEPER
jgi:hypothetical protein